MRILVYEWNSFLQDDIHSVMHEMGIKTDSITWSFKDKNVDEDFEIWIEKHIELKNYDALFSINYYPLLSQIAQRNSIKYISWCYDNPLNVIDIERTLANPVNYVFFFDRVQAQRYKNKGFDTVYYIPLAVNIQRMNKIKLSSTEMGKYTADISLVGSLYESRLQDIKNIVDEYTKGYIDAGISAQQDLYGCYLFDYMITEELICNINNNIRKSNPDTSFVLKREALIFAMASEVTRRERLILLSLLGRRFDTRLFSYHNSSVLKGVKCFPAIDYKNEMPKVFAASRINLNPSLKCIQSGIPLRALDIMSVGGFLLSNYQPELMEYFTEGEDFAAYGSMEEAVDKADFYLKNDSLREAVAMNGKKKITEEFSMRNRLVEILNTAKVL